MTPRAEFHQLLHHTWKVPLKRAAIIQSQLAEQVRLAPLTITPRIVAGIDSAHDGDHYFVAIVVMDVETGKVIEVQCVEGIATFPDKPGYLAFRIGPLILQAKRTLYRRPELYFIAGQGVCHPRLCGIASHIGLRFDLPTIGCTLDHTGGHYDAPGAHAGAYSVVRFSPQAPAVCLRTRKGANPVFVSPGHGIDLLGTIEQTIRMCKGYRLPEPLRRAHIEAGRFMRTRLAKRRGTSG